MSLSPLISALLILGVGVAAAAGTLLVRHVAPRLEEVDPQPWSSTLQYVATAYGVVIGFSILFLFGGFADARRAVGDEATSIGTAFDEVMVFPDDAPRIQRALLCYARAVSEEDWPAMREGGSSPEVDVAYTDLVLSLGGGVEPLAGTFDPAVATNVVVQVGSISTAREARLVAAETRVPPLLWALVLGGGALVVVLIFVVTLPAPPRTQAALVGLSTAFTVVMVLLVVALDRPYAEGSGRISARLVDETIASMEQAAPDLADLSCPVSGGSP